MKTPRAAVDLDALVARTQRLSPTDLLSGALMLLQRGEVDMAESFARLAADKLTAMRLLGTTT